MTQPLKPACATHPGVFIRDEMKERHWTIARLTKETGLPDILLGPILQCSSGVSELTAIGLAKAFGTSKEFWLNLQSQYDEWLATKQ